MCEAKLVDILHELIAAETTALAPLWKPSRANGRSKEKTQADLMIMRKLSKRDAYYRVLHIMYGCDTEYPITKGDN